MNIDTDRLITEVRFRPALWDSSCEMYKERDAKIKAWLEVCQEVIPNFDDLCDIEKKLIEKQVQQRWKTARDAYVRSKTTSGMVGKKRKKYIYYDCMHFLDKNPENTNDVITGNQTLTNAIQIDSWTATQNTREGSNKVTSSNEGASNYDIPKTSRVAKVSRRNLNTNLQKRQKKVQHKRIFNTEDKDFKNEMLKMLKENVELMQNDDMAFFSSLLPITQSFSNYQKLYFRSEVLKKAMEISSFKSEDPLESSYFGAQSSELRDAEDVTLLYPEEATETKPLTE